MAYTPCPSHPAPPRSGVFSLPSVAMFLFLDSLYLDLQNLHFEQACKERKGEMKEPGKVLAFSRSLENSRLCDPLCKGDWPSL